MGNVTILVLTAIAGVGAGEAFGITLIMGPLEGLLEEGEHYR